MSDKIMEAGFDHPCRETCSGWVQGRERGIFDLRRYKEFIIRVSQTTEQTWVPCTGDHSQYSSMHPNADTTCPICQGSEDGPGQNIPKYLPTRLALAAQEVLKEVGL